ncbi:MAG: hypothetical protein KME18_04090 [Phormidium tanganyikae FI6-MK23]|jgi:uncharacterized membrane protein|nr:hypothetical protein [Phormidium tanganyikae FI6-MK23]
MVPEIHSIFFLLGLGGLAIAYRLRLASLGMLAIVLLGLGYWSGWNQIYLGRHLSIIDSIALQMPIVAAILFLPLAYRCRSQKLFLLNAIAVCSALLSSLAEIVTKGSILPSLLLILPAALLWSYDDTLWTIGQREKLFQPIARRLAVLYLGGLFYWMSFHWVWGDLAWYSRILEWRSLPSVAILSAIAIGQWIYLLIQTPQLKTVMIGIMISVSTIVNFWHLQVQPIPIFAPLVFNAMLVILSIVTLRDSLKTGERHAFWFSVMFLSVQILSRLLEYEIDSPLRLLIFGACGISAIAAGLWFEHRVRVLPPTELKHLRTAAHR